MKTLTKMTSKPGMSLIAFTVLLILSACEFSRAAEKQERKNLPAALQDSRPGQTPAVNAEPKNARDFSGDWKLQVNNKQPDQRLASIDRAVAGMGRLKRGRARDMLSKMTTPPMQVKIADTATHVKLSVAGFEATVPTNGETVSIKSERGEVAMKSGKQDGKSFIISKTANATQTSVYQLSADGQSMIQQIQLQSDRLTVPIQFTNRFVR